MAKPPKIRGLPSDLVTPAEWAQATGYHIRHAYHLMEKGDLPYRKFYGHKRIMVRDIEDPAYRLDPEVINQIYQARHA